MLVVVDAMWWPFRGEVFLAVVMFSALSVELYAEEYCLVVRSKVWVVGRLSVRRSSPNGRRCKYVIDLMWYVGWACVSCDVFLLFAKMGICDG